MLDLSSLGIGGTSLMMFGMLLVLLVKGMPLAFVTILVALIFALRGFGTALRTCGRIGAGATAPIGVYNLMGGIDFIEQLLPGVSDSRMAVLIVMMLILTVFGPTGSGSHF